MKKTVSVIVPVYRTQQWLDRCVKSILDQTYRSLEVILVDDGSPDDCPALCDGWAKKDDRVRVLHKKNGGLMAAWMDGVRMSTGAYLMLVDSDDWIDTCMVDNLLRLSSDCGKEVLCGNYVQEEANRSFPVVQTLTPGIYSGRRLEEEVFGRLLGEERRPITLSRCMKLFSRGLIEENMHYCDPAIVMGEDVNITLPTLLSAERIVIAEGACDYHYLYLSESMAHRYDPRLYENIRRLDAVIRKVLEDKKAPNGEEQARRELIWLLFLVVKNEVRGGQKGWQKRLRSICQSHEVAEVVHATKIHPIEKENRLLYLAVKHPNAAVLTGLWLLLTLHDRMKRR